MSVASPPRGGASGRRVIEMRPLRSPDTTDPDIMTHRGWWLVVMNFLVPGSAQALAGNRKLGRFGLAATLLAWTLAIVVGVASLLWWQGVLSLFTSNWIVPTVVQVLLIAYAVLWVVLTLDTLRLVRLIKTKSPARFGIAALAVILMVVSGGTAAYAANVIGVSRDTFGSIFGQGGPSVPPSDGYYNILLLGADSGEGRDSMRFDSISVVSINADTGKTTITGIPRDMANVPFSDGPMHDIYPNGFSGHADASCGWDGHMNHVYVAAEVCQTDGGASLYPEAKEHGSSPGIEATKQAAEGVLGIEIPYYVFVDMNGFAQLVDALGGVEIEVTERLPKGGGPTYEGQPAEEWAIGWIEPGKQRMDGDTAQWYARSRYTTSDWDRMLRQRQLQEAIFAQFSPENVLLRFNEVAEAGQSIVQTDLPRSMLSYFVDLGLKAKDHPVESVELTPEGSNVMPEDPDFGYIHQLVQDALHPSSETSDPES